MASKFFKGGKYVYEKLVPNIAKNLTTKRKIQDMVVATVDKGTSKALKGAPHTQSIKQSSSKWKKDKSGTITGVKPGSKIGKKKTWKDHVDTSHPSYKKNWPPGN